MVEAEEEYLEQMEILVSIIILLNLSNFILQMYC